MNPGTILRDLLRADELDKLLELRSMLDQSALVAQLNTRGMLIDANEKFLRISGYSYSELFKVPLVDLLEAEFVLFFNETVLPILSRGMSRRGELCHKARNGLDFWTEATIAPSFDANRRIRYYNFVAFEVTERKRVETALMNNTVFFTKLMELAPIGFFLAGVDGRCNYINKVWSQISGCRLRQALGSGWLAAVYPDDRFEVEKAWQRFVQTGETFSLEYRYERPDGGIAWVSACAERIDFGPDRKPTLLRAEKDLTERKLNEQLINEQRAKMVASSKLSALGEMAGGIAHEINNPLAILQLRAKQIIHLVESENLNPEKLAQAAENIRVTTDRIAAIIRSLRAIAREGDGDPFLPTAVRTLVDHTLELCAARFSYRQVQLLVKPISPDIEICCRSVEILQVLLNLLNNSLSAVAELEQKWVEISVQEFDADVEVWVTDSGTGIPAEIHSRLFQPFFTTKPIGSGTGLGLSTSRAVALDHQGDLFLDLHCPRTRFVLRLPKVQTHS